MGGGGGVKIMLSKVNVVNNHYFIYIIKTFRVYFCLVPSIHSIDSGRSATLKSIKLLLMMNEWINGWMNERALSSTLSF